MREVGRVEIDRPARLLSRDAVGDLGRDVAVGIDQREARAIVHVRQDEVPKEGGLARAGFADEVQVTTARL